MNVLDLFSGIGGFSLGLERAGMRTVAFCEIDEFCQAVLRKHWPHVPIYDDVRSLTAERLAADGIAADVIAGGFPCQDISTAWNGPGIDGKKSGLWKEYARIIGELRPRFVIVENVANLLGRGLERVLGDLAALGFDAEWHCIPASAIGAPHIRDRIWIVAHADDRQRERPEGSLQTGRDAFGGGSEVMADADRKRCNQVEQPEPGREISERAIASALHASLAARRCGWEAEPDLGRVANGVPARVDRLRALGNAVVPQIPEIIGRAIMSRERNDHS